MFKTLILIVSLVQLIQCLQLTDKSWTSCHDVNTVSSIDVTPCDAEPCTFTRGTDVAVKALFTSESAANGCHMEMKALLGTTWYPISDEPVCQTAIDCPLKTSNLVNTLNFRQLVDNALPAGERLTRWKLICDSGATEVFCADITINIK